MQTHALHLPATARPRGSTPRRFGDHLDPRGHPRAPVCTMGTRTLVRRPPPHPPAHPSSHAHAAQRCKHMRGTSQQLSAHADPLPAGLETSWTHRGTTRAPKYRIPLPWYCTLPRTTASPSRTPKQPRARTPTMQTHALHLPATARPLGSTPRRLGDQLDPRGHHARTIMPCTTTMVL